jgi:hypothetical protein
MKAFFIILSLLSMVSLACQREGGRGIICIQPKGKTETRITKMAEFSSVQLMIPAKVVIQHGSENVLEIQSETNIIENIQTEIRDGELLISFDRCVRKLEPLPVLKITAPYYFRVVLVGSGSVVIPDTLIQPDGDLDLQVLGSGSIDALVRTKGLQSKVSGSGKITLAGIADLHTVLLSGSGDIDGKLLPVRIADVQIGGSGNARVSVTDTLQVKISGSGNLTYWGSPVIVSEITGSGKVIVGN